MSDAVLHLLACSACDRLVRTLHGASHEEYGGPQHVVGPSSLHSSCLYPLGLSSTPRALALTPMALAQQPPGVAWPAVQPGRPEAGPSGPGVPDSGARGRRGAGPELGRRLVGAACACPGLLVLLGRHERAWCASRGRVGAQGTRGRLVGVFGKGGGTLCLSLSPFLAIAAPPSLCATVPVLPPKQAAAHNAQQNTIRQQHGVHGVHSWINRRPHPIHRTLLCIVPWQ